MNLNTERLSTIAALLVLHAGVVINLSGKSTVGNLLVLAGIVFLSLIYAAKGIRSIKEKSAGSNKHTLMLYHTNLIACVYTLSFFYFDMQTFFAAGVFVCLLSALIIIIRKKDIKNISRPSLLKSIIFNCVIIISFMIFLF